MRTSWIEPKKLLGLLLLLVVGVGCKAGREGTAHLGLKHGRSLAIQWLMMAVCRCNPIPELHQACNSKGLPVLMEGYVNLTQFTASL